MAAREKPYYAGHRQRLRTRFLEAGGEALLDYELLELLLFLAQASALRLLRGEVTGKHVIGSWDAVLDYCRASMGREKTEQFHILFLDNQNHLRSGNAVPSTTRRSTPARSSNARSISVPRPSSWSIITPAATPRAPAIPRSKPWA